MQDKCTYEFATIRMVPRVERGEFFNVGAILYCKRKKYLGMKYHIDQKKFDAFSNEIDIETLTNYLEAWQFICSGTPHGGAIGKLELPSRFRWLIASRSTIIQSSEVHLGLCDDPQKALEDLFEKFVL